jgi:hypothetical protein
MLDSFVLNLCLVLSVIVSFLLSDEITKDPWIVLGVFTWVMLIIGAMEMVFTHGYHNSFPVDRYVNAVLFAWMMYLLDLWLGLSHAFVVSIARIVMFIGMSTVWRAYAGR